MTSLEMLREFKVGIDKIDSSSYPEIYDEQIFMFINRYISKLVNEGRKVFEENQTITDNLKSLIPVEPVIITSTISSVDSRRFLFDLNSIGYLFYISSLATTSIGEISGEAEVKVSQYDDINIILKDPHNKPKPYKVPITFSRNTIIGYSDGSFSIDKLLLRYVKKPAIVSALVNCDLDEQIHYNIVEGAIDIALDSLGISKQELDKQ